MKTQWNLTVLIESIFLQLQEGQAFTAEGNKKKMIPSSSVWVMMILWKQDSSPSTVLKRPISIQK